MFRLRSLSKSFGAADAVGPVDLEMEPGTTTVLIGPSGSGKSTLLKLMLGLLTPSAGTVEFQGERVDPLRQPKEAAALRRRMGYVIQGGGLFPHLTAEENVTLLSRSLGRGQAWEPAKIQGRVRELCAVARLDPALLKRYPGEISGGQRQRIALLRALMLDPEVLLLDEPLGALDPMVRRELQDELRETFRALGKTVILVTHDLGEARFFGDTIVLLGEGRVLQQGSFEELDANPLDPFVTRFIEAQTGRRE